MPYRPNYTEFNVDTVATPVTIGDVAGLFGVETPGGKGILFWCTAKFVSGYSLGGRHLYYAVVDDPSQFMVNGIISSAAQIHVIDIFGQVDPLSGYTVSVGNLVSHPTGMVPTNHVARPSVSIIDGSLYLALTTLNFGDPLTRVWKCTAPDVFPLQFTLAGFVQGTGGFDDQFIQPFPASGSLYKVPPSRLVYIGGWKHRQTGGSNYAFDRYGLWYSDDDGATWTNSVTSVFADALGRLTFGYQAPQMEWDPQTGLYFFTQFGVAGTPTLFDVWTSPDGATWTKSYSQAYVGQFGGNLGHGFAHDGTNAYILSNGKVRRLTNLLTWTSEEVGTPGTGAGQYQIQMARRVMVSNSGRAYYFHSDDTVNSMSVATGGWTVGSIGFSDLVVQA